MSIATTPRPAEQGIRIESPEKKPKIRSESSPAKFASPVMKTPSRPAVPRLHLPSSSQASTVTMSPVSDELPHLSGSEPVFRTPRKTAPGSARVRFSDAPTTGGSSSAPVTPRAKSPRGAETMPSTVRHRIDSSPRKRVSLQGANDEVNCKSAQPMPDRELLALGEDLATCFFDELRRTHPRLTDSDVKSLARFEIKLPLDSLSPALRARIKDDGSGKVSHAKLIKALFLQPLLDSDAGKTVKTLRKLAMDQYDGNTLTIADRERFEEENPGFKQRLRGNIEGLGIAASQVILGLNGTHIDHSSLPAELIAFWTAMDRGVQALASTNPGLDLQLVANARANLGFDTVFTRLLLTIAAGDDSESHLAIPQMFFAAVKDAILTKWPAFTASFFAKVAAGVPSATAAPTSTSDLADPALVSSTAVHSDVPTATEKS